MATNRETKPVRFLLSAKSRSTGIVDETLGLPFKEKKEKEKRYKSPEFYLHRIYLDLFFNAFINFPSQTDVDRAKAWVIPSLFANLEP